MAQYHRTPRPFEITAAAACIQEKRLIVVDTLRRSIDFRRTMLIGASKSRVYQEPQPSGELTADPQVRRVTKYCMGIRLPCRAYESDQ